MSNTLRARTHILLLIALGGATACATVQRPTTDLVCNESPATRLENGPFDFSIQSTRRIAAPPSVVYQALIDVDAWAQWNTQLFYEGGRVAPGEILEFHLDDGAGGGFSFSPTVVVLQENKAFGWSQSTGVNGMFDGFHHFVLHPDGDDTCLINVERYSGTLTPAVILTGSFDHAEAGFDRMNDELAAYAERAAP